MRLLLTLTLSLVAWLAGAQPTSFQSAPVEPNVAALLARPINPTQPVVETLGYYSPGDGGGGRWRWVVGDAVTLTNWPSAFRAGIFWVPHQWSGDVRQFGAVPDRNVSVSANLQSAADHAWVIGRGEINLPPGVYPITDTILFPPRVSWRGAMTAPAIDYLADTAISNAVVSGDTLTIRQQAAHWGAAVLFRTPNQTGPMLRFDSSRAVPNTLFPTNTLQDGSTATRWQASVRFRDVVFFGNNLQQETWNQDAISAQHVWDFGVENCAFIRIRGFLVDALNVNGFAFRGNASLGSSIYGTRGLNLWHASDTIISDNVIFGGRGALYWFSEVGGWRSSVIGGLHGNYDGHGWQTVASVSAGVWATDSEHQMESGQPVVVYAGGATMPEYEVGGATNRVMQEYTYWVTKLSPTTLGLHTNHTAHATNGYLPFAGGDAGIAIGPGFASGVYMSSGARQLSVIGGRYDQFYDSGIRIAGGSRSTIVGAILAHNGVSTGLGVVTNRAGTNIANLTITGGGTYTGGDNSIVGCVFAQADHAIRIEGVAANNQIIGAAYNSDLTGGPVSFDGTFAQDANAVILGETNSIRSLRLRGGQAGGSMLTFERAGVPTLGIGLTGTTGPVGLFRDPTNNVIIASVDGRSASLPAVRAGAINAVASPRTGILGAGEDASGENIAGGSTYIDAGRGTGNATSGGFVGVRIPQAESSGSTSQTIAERVRFSQRMQSDHVPMSLEYGTPGVLERVGVTNIAGRSVLHLPNVPQTYTGPPWTLTLHAAANLTPTDGATVYTGLGGATGMNGDINNVRVLIPVNALLTGYWVGSRIGTAGSAEDVVISIWDGSSAYGTVTQQWNVGRAHSIVTNLNVSIAAGTYLSVRNQFPTWATDPNFVSQAAVLYFREQ